jgi:hypothetical protein
MSQIKTDLICEIIRLSQTNLLSEKKRVHCNESDHDERAVVDWIKNNAASYREHFMSQLEGYSATELGEILKALTASKKDLDQVLVPVLLKKNYR